MFQLHRPKLYLRGKHVNAEFLPHNSILDSYDGSIFYVHLKNGLIQTSYLDHTELPDVQNYKKSLISLFQVLFYFYYIIIKYIKNCDCFTYLNTFQFQTSPGERNETDILGECHVLYERISENVFRKIKVTSVVLDLGKLIKVL